MPGLGLDRVPQFERQFWLEMWRIPILEAVEDHRIEVRRYGPVLAFAYPIEPRLSLFNLLLDADGEDAALDGYLDEALDWTESLGLALRVPVRHDSEFGTSDEAEEVLSHRGYFRHTTLATYAREASPPDFPMPEGIEVEPLEGEEMVETFTILLSPNYGLEWTGEGFFIGMPGRPGWNTYIARDAESERPLAAAAMMMHYEYPQLGFAGTDPEQRGRGAHTALLHRQLADAAASPGATLVFAVIEEPGYPEETSPAARNLSAAGFRLVDIRTVWRPPEDRIAPIDTRRSFGDLPR